MDVVMHECWVTRQAQETFKVATPQSRAVAACASVVRAGGRRSGLEDGGMLGRMMDLLSKPVEKRVVLLGLDNAGKTTAVYRLLLGKKVDTVPTVGFNSEEIRMNRFSLIMWDIGGQSKIRKLWKHYLESADALIFVVDAQDRTRLKEARSAFKRMLKHKTLKDTVLLIYANKTDYEDSMTVPEIIKGLEVHEVIGDRKWYIQKTCAISGQGLKEGLEWLCRALSFKGGHHGASVDEHGEKAQHMKRVPAKQ